MTYLRVCLEVGRDEEGRKKGEIWNDKAYVVEC